MKAIEFMIGHAAMCKHYGGIMKGCNKGGEKCPLAAIDCDLSADMSVEDAEQMQAIVDKWMHKDAKTNADKFLEVFGIYASDFWALCDVNATEWMEQRYEGE